MKRLALLALVVVAGCTTVPPTNIHQPMTARPPLRNEVPAANGAIWQAGQTRPLFEDRRARYVGDTITIRIVESTNATTSSNNKVAKAGGVTASVNAIAGLPGKGLQGMNLDASSNNTFSGSGQAANNNVFTGNMTATVIEVLPNGNLLVSGEKQVAIGQEQEYVRISGIVNPSFIDTLNTVPSSAVADARIEYKSSGQVSESQVMGWLARFFLSVLPF
ncbi:flagellar basal body L-ring protein FlgH [Azonexus sp.]|jgi:flagellar L-ring protein precursor FlgH|uniref:flagellar basal body L-ring protein FlgH n=1 Tax=Azonexus sp. TaxID=1872668 RepID=UPI002835F514|nr:flagellar basal body L-ring protein FlgH [Azonexus sp.]MDR1995060.1 flagellar basal body L-ring protein FlgH [Azonexus sp.]